ncbi:hypothetical protein AQS8620_01769 [Aquimixticola soesokkakensis]|uniref:DUF3307 domain-containing protein n=1 Tax=Aquimixticola soesokkakensis TaxID=1519096 RepID=A0A1Y5SPK0_9RHOB|nr:DUF3307 domain-containing protein [Aquimixticola soesokkakensis]SLN44236.1 hypothetical protein AQS8620_01769 [Aquimixticola soesokkakensis]
MFDTLAVLLLAHVLADYVFQSGAMVARKHHPRVLLGHALIVWLCAVALIGTLDAWQLAALAGAHLAIDVIKVYAATHRQAGETAGLYLADQLAHLVTLAAVAGFAPDLFASGVWADLPWMPRACLLLAGAIYTTRAGGFAVGQLMAPFGAGRPEASLPRGGVMIGLLERGLIYLMFLAGHPAGIGFLIAAKSILRFESGSKDSATAEYVIIGTLASFGWAIAVSLGIWAIHNGMIGAPLLEIMGTSD